MIKIILTGLLMFWLDVSFSQVITVNETTIETKNSEPMRLSNLNKLSFSFDAKDKTIQTFLINAKSCTESDDEITFKVKGKDFSSIESNKFTIDEFESFKIKKKTVFI